MKLHSNFFENLTQDQFDYVLNVLVMYKQLNPKKDVYLNERCFKSALGSISNLMNSQTSKN